MSFNNKTITTNKCALTAFSVFPDKIIENYNYYDYDVTDEKQGQEAPETLTEQFDALTRSRRDTEKKLSSDNTVTYTVCVRLD